ncbi:uncharacterized protein METZ01_LOCUS500509, partial [marine metagenome]
MITDFPAQSPAFAFALGDMARGCHSLPMDQPDQLRELFRMQKALNER